MYFRKINIVHPKFMKRHTIYPIIAYIVHLSVMEGAHINELPPSVKRQKRINNLQIKIMESQRTKQHIRKPHKPTHDQSLQKSCFHVHAHRIYSHYD